MEEKSEHRISVNVVERDDHSTPIKGSRKSHVVIEGARHEADIRQAMLVYYHSERAQLQGAYNSTRHIHVFAYPSEERARAQRGDWQAMISVRVIAGDPLPNKPEVKIRTGELGDDAPTVRENQIADALAEAFDEHDSAGDYQTKVLARKGQLSPKDIEKMVELQDLDEKRAVRKVARQHRVSPKEVDDIYLRVLAARLR